MKRITEAEKEKFRQDLIHGKTPQAEKQGLFGIIYRDMIKHEQDPFGKDINLFFRKLEKLRDDISQNPNLKRLHGGIE